MPEVADYLNLVTAEHSTKPKFNAYLAALLQPFVDGQAVLASMPTAFDLDYAVGVQLDAVGVRVGRSRNISTPITGIYFSLDIAGLGLDEGYLQGRFDPADGLTSLDDDHYRLLLRAKVAANHWDGTIPGAAVAIAILQIAPTLVFFQDNQDMSMTLAIAGPLPDRVAMAILTGGYLPLKPTAVRLDLAITTVDGDPLFGLDVENEYVSGLDVGTLGATTFTGVYPPLPALWGESYWGDGGTWS
jgi:hypothetical protein